MHRTKCLLPLLAAMALGLWGGAGARAVAQEPAGGFPRIDVPVDPGYVAELSGLIPDFRRAYDAEGLRPAEFDTYGATTRTLRQFIKAYHDLVAAIRDIILPNPDLRTA